MAKYSTESKEQALLLSDKIGMKKVAEQMGINYYTIVKWRKAKEKQSIPQNISMRTGWLCASRTQAATRISRFINQITDSAGRKTFARRTYR